MRARLAKVPHILKRFRQAVLAAACAGRLTEEWRENHPEQTDAALRRQDLLTRREDLWKSREDQRRLGRVTKYKAPPPATPPDGVEVPETWTWATVAQMALIDVGFAFKSTGFAESGVRLLRGENVEPGQLRWRDTRYWPSDDLAQCQHLLVEPGEIILAMDRPIISTGLKLARVRASDVPAVLVQRVMRFKMVDAGDSDYLHYCLLHKRFVDFLAHEGMTGSDLPHITGTGVAEFPIPLPPLAEQHEIVRRVDALFSLADAIERRVALATARAEKVPQAILNKAFRGELVPTEAELARAEGRTYEPASDMLARIRKEREATAATPSRAKAPRRKAAG
jgi:type I restriction enzyme S subunit